MIAKKDTKQIIGVILMTYGSPKTSADIPTYLKNVYGGYDANAETIVEFRRRYKLIGGSPLVRITNEQAANLEKELNQTNPQGIFFQVLAGMRFSDPFIKNVVQKFSQQTDQIVGIIMSPQYSPIIMKGYIQTLEEAAKSLENKKIRLTFATDWHLQPHFIKALAKRVEEALDKFPNDVSKKVTVLFSAHSMPKRVIDKEPEYINALKQTADAVAKEVGLRNDRWMFCYQSAGHTPEEWLKPDFADIMPELKKNGLNHVLIAPVQFLADHLEILYDVDIGAREQAEQHGIIFARIESLNTSPLFIKALVEVVEETLSRTNLTSSYTSSNAFR